MKKKPESRDSVYKKKRYKGESDYKFQKRKQRWSKFGSTVAEFRVEGATHRVRLAPGEHWESRKFRPDRAYREWGKQ